MALTPSTMLELETTAPDFSLPDTDGSMVSLSDFTSCEALLAMFICNHCPYVKHVADGIARLAGEYQSKGVGVVAISSNDVAEFPDDSPEKMKQEKAERGYTFPYLFDETQEVAKAYRAACTPDFFVFNAEGRLVYRGQMDDSRPERGIPVSGRDLQAALNAALEGRQVELDQKPSLGCNIKWKPGNEPDYFTS